MGKQVTTAETYKLLKEMKDHLYGDKWGHEGDISTIKEHLRVMNGAVADTKKEAAMLPCKTGTMLGCIPRKVFIRWVLILIVMLTGGSVGLDRVVALLGG
jgi:hypothetical protein|tara:strand:- start:11826 stop:12125 length:300 start_codon:yes stop_codon:yes gene_type:complete